jgi:hypothetical protein
MLIDYTERVFHTLYRPLLPADQEEIFDTFRRVGVALEIPDLPTDYNSWKRDRQVHLEKDLVLSSHTVALCTAYRRDLGFWRYTLLRQIQAVLVSKHVHKLLNLPRFTWLRPTTLIYPTLLDPPCVDPGALCGCGAASLYTFINTLFTPQLDRK